MDFIHDNGADRLKQPSAFLGGEQNEQRLRRRDEDMRRALEHLLPIRHRRVAGSDQHTQLGHQ